MLYCLLKYQRNLNLSCLLKTDFLIEFHILVNSAFTMPMELFDTEKFPVHPNKMFYSILKYLLLYQSILGHNAAVLFLLSSKFKKFCSKIKLHKDNMVLGYSEIFQFCEKIQKIMKRTLVVFRILYLCKYSAVR